MSSTSTVRPEIIQIEWDADINRGILTYQGRINRARYIGQLVGLYVAAFLCGLLFYESEVMVSLGVFTISLAASAPIVRRFHDLNKSGWHYWLSIIPVIGFFVGLYLLFVKGTEGDNEYGPDPLQPA